jgi:hypothetical protein
MTKNHEKLGAEVLNGILDTSQGKSIHDVSCKANNKKIAKPLVKNQLWRDTRVRATDDNCKRLLTLGYLLSAPGILPRVLLLVCYTTLITVKQFL